MAKEAVQNYVKGLNSVSTAKSNILLTSKMAASPALSRMALGTSLLTMNNDTSPLDEEDEENEGQSFEDAVTGKDLSTTFTPSDGPSAISVISVDSSKGKIEAGNTHVVNGGTVYTALNAEQTAREAADTALSNQIGTLDTKVNGKADVNLGNITDAGRQVIRDTMKSDLDQKADKKAVDEALTKKADADAANIDVNTFTKKLGTGSVAEGNANLVTGDTVYQTIQKTDAGLVKSDGKVMTLGKSDTASVIDVSGASGARATTGVATDPMDATSAANVGYVNTSAQGLHNEIQGVQQSLTDDIKKVGADAAALAGLHPQDYDPEDKWDFAVGYGNYRGQNASAVAAYYHPNEDTLFNFGTTLGNGDNMVTAGVSFKFGPSSDTHTMSRTALTQKLSAVTQENQTLKENVSTLRQGIFSLSEKNASLEKDVSDLRQLVTKLQKEMRSKN